MKNYFLLFIITTLFISCIGDDIIDDAVPERLTINNLVDSIQVSSTYQFDATFFNNVGQIDNRAVTWMSTNEAVMSIDNQGLASANIIGEATVIASVQSDDNTTLETEHTLWVIEGETVVVEEPTERSGQVNTTSSYALTGDFTLKDLDNGQLDLIFEDNYEASAALPGLYIYLSNNPNSTNGAFEIGRVDIFSGAHSYLIDGVGIEDFSYVLYFCKPFNVKVGDGLIN